jgi:alkylated DNA repair dioxygenase AlkB
MSTLFEDTELFSSGDLKVTRFDIPDAELVLYEHFFDKKRADHFYKALLEETSWKQEELTIHGQTHLTPRLTAWYGDRRDDKPPLSLTPVLQEIKNEIEKTSGYKFTSVLLNYYRSGKDSVSWHRDHDREFGPNPVVGSVSFGETRPFNIRHKFRKDLGKIVIPLHHGSFLLMAGAMQHFWEHQIPKTTKEIKPRINLTFRVVK